MSDPWLITERLRLDRPGEANVPDVFRVHGDPLTYLHHQMGVMLSLDEAESMWMTWSKHWDAHGFGYATVRVSTESPVLGFAGLKWMPFNDRTVLNLYYRFAPAAWGQGYAAEVARALVRWAGTERPGADLIAKIAANNLASIRVADRAGLAVSSEVDGSDGVRHQIFHAPYPHPQTPRA